MQPRPLPSGLGPGPFSSARARELGVPSSRLRRGDLVHPTRGAHATSAPDTLTERATAYQAGMPSARAFSHRTAAHLWGVPLPGKEEPNGTTLLDVMAPTGDGMVIRRGAKGHRGLETRAVATIPGTGLRVVDLADTWCDLGELKRGALSVGDLVVAADAVVAALDARAGRQVGIAMLRSALAARVRPRGGINLRRALARARHGVRSPMETRARLMFVDAGFPEPEVNAPLTDVAGEWLAEGDLVWRPQRVVGEYQGGHHAERKRRSEDAFRRRLLEDQRWHVEELWAEDVRRGPRRRTTLLVFAHALGLDPCTLQIT
ncbi:MAG: hypothetical protein ABI249_07485 [Ornithinibacter sp.]